MPGLVEPPALIKTSEVAEIMEDDRHGLWMIAPAPAISASLSSTGSSLAVSRIDFRELFRFRA